MPLGSIDLDQVRKDGSRVLLSNASASLLDLDDGVLCLEFHSKGNTLDEDTLAVAEHAMQSIPGRYRALVVGNQGTDFSFGANLRWLLGLLAEIGEDSAALSAAAKRFQRMTTGMRTAPFPTVSAPFARTIGGAIELTMFASGVQAHTGLRAVLPEIAVGILPDLGGTSELYARSLEQAGEEHAVQALRDAFGTIVYMRGSADAEHARRLNFLLPADRVTNDADALVAHAKAYALELADRFLPRGHRESILVLGDDGFAQLASDIDVALASEALSPHDAQVARAIARVMTGAPGRRRHVRHEELLDGETREFQLLVGKPQTAARMRHMLQHGTPLRN
ncbi:MAG TPA: enoyl-CoA hydratase/isomerase family protein [Candidatus Baltobacteraceae bacterium]|jgi:3-hydroxyacyl-CoA dehydrogenase|nr:enoyl-CoA hydratase/isomerase family protein [Candidatus Baltobacteraceae bacterium]